MCRGDDLASLPLSASVKRPSIESSGSQSTGDDELPAGRKINE